MLGRVKYHHLEVLVRAQITHRLVMNRSTISTAMPIIATYTDSRLNRWANDEAETVVGLAVVTAHTIKV